MIKINLARKRKTGTSGGATGLTSITGKIDLKNLDLRHIFDTLRRGGSGDKKFDLNGPIPKAIISIALCYFVEDTIVGYKQDELKKYDKAIAAVEKDKSGLQARMAKMKGYEAIKKQLEDDEKAIRTKIEIVKRLLENRNVPAKMLMQIAQSIPEELWLTTLKVNESEARFAGATPGYNQVSDFIKSLNGTAQFTEIGLSGIRESTTATKDQRFQSFELTAKRRALD